MLKRFILVNLLLLFVSLSVFAVDFRSLPCEAIKDGDKIINAEGDNWSSKVKKKDFYYVKSGSEFFAKDDSVSFDTECDYIFIYKGSLIGYSPNNIKFYEFSVKNTLLNKRELLPEEVESVFKDFRIIKITDFSTTTNVYKFKKKHLSEKIMILNDTDRDLSNYSFTSNNSDFALYPINNAIEVLKSGMLQFSGFGDNTKESPWFIVLVR